MPPVVIGAAAIGIGLTAAGVVGGLLIIGGALQVVGGLTKDAELTKIGGVITAVGGAAALATALASPAAGELAGATAGEAGAASGAAAGADIGATAEALGAPGEVVATNLDAVGGMAGAGAAPAPVEAANPLTSDVGPNPLASDTGAPPANVVDNAAIPDAGGSANPAGTITQTPAPKGFIESHPAATMVLGQGIIGAYQARAQENIAEEKRKEEERKLAEEERRRQGFNQSVLDAQINLRPWEANLRPGQRPLINTARRTT